MVGYGPSPDAWNSLPSHLHFITDTAAVQLQNVNSKFNFLDKHSTTDNYHYITIPHRMGRAALYKFHLYYIVLAEYCPAGAEPLLEIPDFSL